MNWARILTPLSGGAGDAAAVAAGALLARPLGAELACVYTPADLADVMPWMGEGFMGGVQTAALESLKEATAVGEASARKALTDCAYDNKVFLSLQPPVWAGRSAESRLSDVVVFTNDPARGRGPLAEAFQQVLADEQRPVLIVRDGFRLDGVVAVAWDGGKEASRAARLAIPLLELAAKVVIIAAPKASSRTFDPHRLQAYYAARNLKSEVQILKDSGDAAPAILRAAASVEASTLVAGAFGHPRLQEFIFGGATRTLLNSDGPTLFLSH